MTAQELLELQNQVRAIQIDPSLIDYVISIGNSSRQNDPLQIGVSPRGALALVKGARATAMLDGRDYLVPDDIISNVIAVCAHHVVTKTYMHDDDGEAAHRIMQQVLETVPSPV